MIQFMICDLRFTISSAGANLKLGVAAFGRKPHSNFWELRRSAETPLQAFTFAD
jgi:hypothetical protein